MVHTYNFSPAAFFEGSEEGTYALYAGTIVAAQRPTQMAIAPEPVKSAPKPSLPSPAQTSAKKSDKSAAAAPQQAEAKPSSYITKQSPPNASELNVYMESEEVLFYPTFAPLRVDLGALPPLAYSTISAAGGPKDSPAKPSEEKVELSAVEVAAPIVQKEAVKSAAPARSYTIDAHFEAEEFLFYPNQPAIISCTKVAALTLAYIVVPRVEQPAQSPAKVETVVVAERVKSVKDDAKSVHTMDSGVDLGKPDSSVLVEPVQKKKDALPEPEKAAPLSAAPITSSDGFNWADEVDEVPAPALATRSIEVVQEENVAEEETVASQAQVVATAVDAALAADEESDGDWKEVVSHSRKKQTTKRTSVNYGSPALKGKRNSEAPSKRQSSSVASTPIPETKEVKEAKPASTPQQPAAALPPKPAVPAASPAPSPSPADAHKKTWAALTSSTVLTPSQPNSPASKLTPAVIPAVVPAKPAPSPAQSNSKRASNAQKSGNQKGKGSLATKPVPAASAPPRTPTPNASAAKQSPKPTPTAPVAAAAAPRMTGSPLPATSVWGKKAQEATAVQAEDKNVDQVEREKEAEQPATTSAVESAAAVDAVSAPVEDVEEPAVQPLEPEVEVTVKEVEAESAKVEEEASPATVVQSEAEVEVIAEVVEPVPQQSAEIRVVGPVLTEEELPADSSPDEVLQGQIVEQVFATESPETSAFNTDDDSSQQLLTQRLTQEVDEITEDEPVSMGGQIMFNPYSNVDPNGVPIGYYMPNGDVQVPHAYYLDANGIPVMYEPNTQHYNPYAVYDPAAYEAYGAVPMNLNLEAAEFVPSPIPHVNGNLSLDAEEFVPYGVDERRGSWNLNATEFVPTSPMVNRDASPHSVNRRPTNPRRGGGTNRRSMVRNSPGLPNGSHHYIGAQGYRSMSPGIHRRNSSANHSADGHGSSSTPTVERVSRPTRRESTGVHEPRSRSNRTSWAAGGPQPNVATLSDFVSKEHLAALNARARKGSEKAGGAVNGHESDSAATTAVASPSSPRGENGEVAATSSGRVERSSSVRTSGGSKGKKGKCIYGQGCINKDRGCAYFHPTEMCRYFPDCNFGSGCMYIHPKANGQGAVGEMPLSAGDSE